MAGHIITVKLTRAQARALIGIVDDITEGHEVSSSLMGDREYARAVVASKRLTSALVASVRDDREAAAA